MTQIVVVGANPAWQKVVRCERLSPGEVVRARRIQSGAAGKGFNCAQAIASLGERVVLVSGVGEDAEAWRQACLDHRLEVFELPLEGETRAATTVIEVDGRVTEIVEEGPPASARSQHVLEERLAAHPVHQPLAFCGTFPEGFDMAGIASCLEARTGLVVVDSIPLVRELLHRPVVCPGLVLKLNFAEWKSVVQHWTVDGLLAEVRHRLGEVGLVLTAGADGAYAEDASGRRRQYPVARHPDLTQVHPIGAGDAFTAGMVVGHARGLGFLEACAFGSVAAQVSCRHPLPSRLARAEVDHLWAEVS
ncbi:MAG TPA: PfkB family carbohydrate kinase [Fibrobacteria bacterium]|nr:PfkB family carbohydrate kinase [Fibrobacteria bacterium]HOX52696.1 PfkB family carbohydrate kinase [Fibrobacteria bacterium]